MELHTSIIYNGSASHSSRAFQDTSYNVYMNSGFSLSVRSSHLHSRLAHVHIDNASERSDLLLVLKLNISRVSSNQRLLLILPDAVEVDECYDTQANAVTDDNGNLGGNITRRVLLAESLGAYMWELRQSNPSEIQM